MSRDARIRELQRELRSVFAGDVLSDRAALARYAHNFGGMFEREPALVLRPANAADVLAALRGVTSHGLTVSTRGAGHSQALQNLGADLILDMTRLRRVLSIDAAAQRVTVEAGASWFDLVSAVQRHALFPVGLTHALDTTVAGTLSVAGVGAQSCWAGPQVDQVLSLEVATPAGELVCCDARREPALFDAVRAGLGQCGVILTVTYPLRAHQPSLTTRCLGYRRIDGFLRDLRLVSEASDRGRWITCTLIRDPSRQSQHAFMLLVGEEQGSSLGRLQADFELPSLHRPLWTEDGQPGHPFFRVFGCDALMLNPWIEQVVPWSEAGAALELLLQQARALAWPKTGIFPLRRGPCPAPLFVTPEETLALGVGLFASFAPSLRAAAHAQVTAFAKQLQALGGARYLSGYVTYAGAAEWEQHYGDAWAGFARAKRLYDPGSQLNPGFVHWL